MSYLLRTAKRLNHSRHVRQRSHADTYRLNDFLFSVGVRLFCVGFLFLFLTRTREVILPKFKLEKSYDLIDYLRSMGTEELFNEKGNYSGISDEKVTINRVFTSLLSPLWLNYITWKHRNTVKMRKKHGLAPCEIFPEVQRRDVGFSACPCLLM